MSDRHVATGIAITFATGFLAELLSVRPPGPTREVIDVTHMASTARTFEPGDLINWGQLRGSCQYDPSVAIPIANAPETVTLTWADSGSSTMTFTGFMVAFEITGELEGKITADFTIQVASGVTQA